MRLDGAAGDEHSLTDRGVREPFGDERHDAQLGRREALPSPRRTLARPARAAYPYDGLVQRQVAPFAVGALVRAVAELRAERRLELRDVRRVGRPSLESEVGAGPVRDAERPGRLHVAVRAGRDLG